jgi:penicillin-binding protein 1C
MRLPRAALVAALLLAAGAAQALPSFSEVREGHRSSETELLSREGEVLQRQRTDTSVRRGDWVALE